MTYFINIICEELNNEINIKAIFLISVPNGELKGVYKDEIYNASKNKGVVFGYKYQKMPKFELLANKPYKIRKLFV